MADRDDELVEEGPLVEIPLFGGTMDALGALSIRKPKKKKSESDTKKFNRGGVVKEYRNGGKVSLGAFKGNF